MTVILAEEAERKQIEGQKKLSRITRKVNASKRELREAYNMVLKQNEGLVAYFEMLEQTARDDRTLFLEVLDEIRVLVFPRQPGLSHRIRERIAVLTLLGAKLEDIDDAIKETKSTDATGASGGVPEGPVPGGGQDDRTTDPQPGG